MSIRDIFLNSDRFSCFSFKIKLVILCIEFMNLCFIYGFIVKENNMLSLRNIFY